MQAVVSRCKFAQSFLVGRDWGIRYDAVMDVASRPFLAGCCGHLPTQSLDVGRMAGKCPVLIVSESLDDILAHDHTTDTITHDHTSNYHRPNSNIIIIIPGPNPTDGSWPPPGGAISFTQQATLSPVDPFLSLHTLLLQIQNPVPILLPSPRLRPQLPRLPSSLIPVLYVVDGVPAEWDPKPPGRCARIVREAGGHASCRVSGQKQPQYPHEALAVLVLPFGHCKCHVPVCPLPTLPPTASLPCASLTLAEY